MPWSNEQKQKTRERILASAVQLFSSRGFDNVSIGEVMQDAGLTHGGFYAHFGSKQALYAAAVIAAAQESALAKVPETASPGESVLTEMLARYLDRGHVRQEHAPCPLAILATDVANREEDVRVAYTQVFRRMVSVIRRKLPVETPERGSRALALSAMMIGAVAVSRALDDESAMEALLDACKTVGAELIGAAPDPGH